MNSRVSHYYPEVCIRDIGVIVADISVENSRRYIGVIAAAEMSVENSRRDVTHSH